MIASFTRHSPNLLPTVFSRAEAVWSLPECVRYTRVAGFVRVRTLWGLYVNVCGTTRGLRGHECAQETSRACKSGRSECDLPQEVRKIANDLL